MWGAVQVGLWEVWMLKTEGQNVSGFTVKGPAEPVIVQLGADATLPCQLSPESNVDSMHIRWYRTQLSPAVLVYQNGQEQGGEQMLEYRGRTELMRNKGSVALVIQHVRVSDDGQYRCHFKDGDISQEAIVELNVIGLGSAPNVYMTGPEDGGIRVLCSSGGWFPKPKLQWKDMAGLTLPSLSEFLTQDGDGLFHVEASLVVTDSSLSNVTCTVQNPLSGQEKASAIFLPEPFFPRMSPWKAALAGTIPVLGLLLIGISYFGWREHQAKLVEIKKREEKASERDEMRKRKENALEIRGKLKNDLEQRKALYREDWRKALLYPDWRKEHFKLAQVTLKQENLHLNNSDPERKENCSEETQDISLSNKEGDVNLITLNQGSLIAGRYYWEVDVGVNDEWSLGIYESYKDESLRKFIVLEKKGDDYWTLIRDPKAKSQKTSLQICPKEKPPQKIVIFMDYEDSDLSFYNLTEGTHIHSFTQMNFFGSLYPYFTLKSMEP
ncbi:PREDICTED: butyrophilin-like protein 1-like [Chrysochloris asiatica]|uniref:Butyrophilin-like protein 1-like n=1 Tax=Chrysochloris asiatica TaxID=185453 RepID=A0A9B0TH55_CHRAS|nr:PREDICTED: butyrophilin-like protein 1-like [Chrysochloris asiatica]